MNDAAFLAVFPFLFIGMWFAISSLLGWLSGWLTLQERFPDRQEPPIERLRFQSAGLGKGHVWNPWGKVSYSRCLRFDLCRTGLRVAIWRIFGLFCHPFLVPWERISVEEKRILFFRVYQLSFGDDKLSALTIRARTYERIKASGFLRNN
jgi:hypothetical protein